MQLFQVCLVVTSITFHDLYFHLRRSATFLPTQKPRWLVGTRNLLLDSLCHVLVGIHQGQIKCYISASAASHPLTPLQHLLGSSTSSSFLLYLYRFVFYELRERTRVCCSLHYFFKCKMYTVSPCKRCQYFKNKLFYFSHLQNTLSVSVVLGHVMVFVLTHASVFESNIFGLQM